MIQEAILHCTKKEDLSFEMAQAVMDEMMEGKATAAQIAGYLVALSMKGETVEEITASAEAMRRHAVPLPSQGDTLEIVGTGGDKSNSFNISTTSALLLAAAGVKVAKHGNRASSSQCGSADVLEALGVAIDVPPEKALELLDKVNICFLFAQRYHSAMKYVAPVRREMGVRTIFNILGPLSNPLGATMQLLGVYEEALMEPMARALSQLGVKSGMVVYGTDGLDEISMSAVTKVCEIRDGVFTHYEVSPTDFGFALCDKEELVGGSPDRNAEITRAILGGEVSSCSQAVAMNAGAAYYLTRSNLTLPQAVKAMEELLASGKALDTLAQFVALSQE